VEIGAKAVVSRVKTVANNAASLASVARHVSRAMKTPVRKASQAVRSPRSCAAATN
jgi:hypothetical protein